MKYEEFKEQFARLSRKDKERFMREVGFGICCEMMRDAKAMEHLLPCCKEMMEHMPEPFRHWMEEWMEVGAAAAKR